jgi:hypothetical protein
MIRTSRKALLLAVAAVTLAAPLVIAQTLPRTPAPAGASVYVISPANGATVKGPQVTVLFGLKGMGISPAGMPMGATGHHHLLIDSALPTNLATPMPANDQLVHFGKGQTEATVTLKPGKHTLQLVLGDHNHVPFDPLLASDKITITVTE